MPCPVKPSEFAAAVPVPTDTICEQIRKREITAYLWYSMLRYMFNNDGTISDAYAADICTQLTAVGCHDGITTTTSTPT